MVDEKGGAGAHTGVFMTAPGAGALADFGGGSCGGALQTAGAYAQGRWRILAAEAMGCRIEQEKA